MNSVDVHPVARTRNPQSGKSVDVLFHRCVKFVFGGYFLIDSLSYILLGGSALGGKIDEIMAACIVALAIAKVIVTASVDHRALGWLAMAMWILFVGAISLYANRDVPGGVKPLLIVLSALIDLKPYLLAIAVYSLYPASRMDLMTDLVKFLCVIFLSLTLISFAFCLQDVVRGIDVHGRHLQHRAGLVVPVGIYDSKFKTAFMAFAGFVSYIALFDRRNPASVAIMVLTLASVGIILSVKEIIAVGVVLLIRCGFWGYRLRNLPMLMALTLLGATVLVTDNPISEATTNRIDTFGDYSRMETVRGALYKYAPRAAADYFPFGSGWGTFGSSPSRDVYYSPLYYRYGISKIYGGSRDNGKFLLDTFWPKILAEQGFFGFIFYVSIFVSAGWASVRWLATSDDSVLKRFAVCAFFPLLIISMATPVFNFSYGSVIAGVVIAILLKRKWEMVAA